MAHYLGLSRTYRPQTFSSVLGQEAIVTTLQNALRNKKTAQAYLFCGTRGTGKTTLARILAKALNCPNLSNDAEPCNKCPSCEEISQGKNLNVLEIDGASNRGIDDIRQLNETVAYAPTAFGCKIFIIDEAHMLTKEAFNALLKTLEEPPTNVKFFLATTEVHKIPPTIISRCQKFDLQRISAATLAMKLGDILKEQSRPYEEEAIYALASFADGSMRVAESLLDQILCFSEGPITEKHVSDSLGTLPTEDFFFFDKAFSKNDLPFAFTWAARVFSSGKDLLHFFECLLDHYKNLLSTKMRLNLEKTPIALQKKYQASSELYTEEQLLYILDYLIERHDKMHKIACKRVTLEMILLHILRSKNRVSATDLVLRLQELEEKPEPLSSIPEIKIITEVVREEPIQPEITLAVQKEPEGLVFSFEEPKPCPIPVEIPLPPKPSPESSPSPNKDFQMKYDTLTRFAAVELEGTLSKE